MEAGQDFKDVPCAFCDTSVVGRVFVLCAQCEVPLHRDCWEASGNCPAYACGSTSYLDPALVIFRKPKAALVVTEKSVPAASTTALTPQERRSQIVLLESRISAIQH